MFLCFVSNGKIGTAAGYNITEVLNSVDCLGFVAQSASSFVNPSTLDTLFKTYFEFTPSLFSLIVGFNLVAFVTGYGIRRVVRGLSML